MKIGKPRSSKDQLLRAMSLMGGKCLIYSICIVFMAILFGLGMEVYMSYKLKYLLDAAVNSKIELIKQYSIQMGLVIVIISVICPILSYVIFYCIKKTMADVRVKLYKKMVNLPASFYDKKHSKEIISCFNNDLNLLEKIYFWPIFTLLCAIMIGIGAVMVLFSFSPIIAVFSLIMGGITVVINKAYSKSLRKESAKIQSQIANMSGIISDYLKSFFVCKIYSIGELFFKKFNTTNDLYFKSKMNYTKKNASLESVNITMSYFSYLFIVFIGTIFVYKHILTIGTAIACIQLHYRVEYMFDNFGNFIANVQNCLAGSERVFKMLDEKEEEINLKENNNLCDLIGCKESLVIKDLSFSYNEEEMILNDVNISTNVGELTAIVGKSGSGKSSIAKILLGFYPFRMGNIYIKGQSIKNYSLKEIRDMISYVPQEPLLFYGTIKENIGLGIDDDEKIINVAKAAHIHNFINDLPDKYNTIIGQNGIKLSGGEKQRIAIARTLLRNAPIIIFDEATSALEHELELKIFKAIKKISPNCTIVIISHRISTLEIMDKILILEDGKIIANGTHDELMHRCETYCDLVNLQIACN